MQYLGKALDYFLANAGRFWDALVRHMQLSALALLITVVICVPLGIFISRRVTIAQTVISFFGALRLIPSLAILFLALPYLGLGFRPALFALIVLAFPPVLINTYAGLRNVDRSVIEAANGMGMTPAQVLRRIEVPLAAPAVIAGIRIASVEIISSATLAAFIGGGGLGDFITRGFALNDPSIMLVGAVPIALLALASEGLFGTVQRRLTAPVS